jgi:hypothetical protein
MTKLSNIWFDGMVEKFFGTPAFKLSRKDDPATSHQAAQAIDTTKMESLVYETIAAFGPDGCISDDVLSKLSFLPYSSVTARYKALIDKGFIEVIGTRKGVSGRLQRVMRKLG